MARPLSCPGARRQRRNSRVLLLGMVFMVLSAAPGAAQVHYHSGGGPWNQKAGSGPDAEVTVGITIWGSPVCGCSWLRKSRDNCW